MGPLLTQAVNDVSAELDHDRTWKLWPAATDQMVTSVVALNYVVGNVRAGVYGWRQDTNQALPTSDPESILSMRAGICGHADILFRSILTQGFGYATREVQITYEWQGAQVGHVCSEVQWGGCWHFFDSTFSAFYLGTDVLAADTLKGSGDAYLGLEQHDATHGWVMALGVAGAEADGFRGILDPSAAVVYA